MAQFGHKNDQTVQVSFCPTAPVQVHWLRLHLQAQTKGGTCVSPETGSINNFLFLPETEIFLKKAGINSYARLVCMQPVICLHPPEKHYSKQIWDHGGETDPLTQFGKHSKFSSLFPLIVKSVKYGVTELTWQLSKRVAPLIPAIFCPHQEYSNHTMQFTALNQILCG